MSFYTYQDYLEIEQTETAKTNFMESVIGAHKNSDFYKQAEIAEDYAAHRNRTINEFQKLLYDTAGNVMPDNYSANYKLASNFFGKFVRDQVQFLLGNGASWTKEDTGEKLGDDFDDKLQKIAKYALIGGVGYGFFNYDHLDAFSAMEFAPLWDEENGALRAGIRFWQIDSTKPMRATFYEEDGYTEYIKRTSGWEFLEDDTGRVGKKSYIEKITASEADLKNGTAIYDGRNYPTFPIIPLWGNEYHQSELVGIREQIDCYDLIKSGYANDTDEASFVYWSISNAGGMDEIDISEFLERLRRLRAAITTDYNSSAEPHQIEAPYQGRADLLEKLRADLYEDFQALDVKNIADGATTATQIMAAYEPMNSKADEFEYQVLTFVDGILKVAGIEDTATFQRSYIVNKTEEIQALLQAAQFLDYEYVMQKVLTLLGDGDKYAEMQAKIDAEEISQLQIDEDVTEDENA